jgi:hypothetical protein
MLVPAQALQCVNAGVKGFGLDPKAHAGEINSVLGEASVQPFFDLIAKAAADPACAAQCATDGDNRLKLTLGVVKGLCDHALAESRKIKAPDSPLLVKTIAALSTIC